MPRARTRLAACVARPHTATGNTDVRQFVAGVYVPRSPAESPLFKVVQSHLLEVLAEARRRSDGAGVPGFVEQELRDFLFCGSFARGFARFLCDSCRAEILVAFSCKGRGFCPSCCGRRMAELSMHLVDSVLGGLPIRQWVLTCPGACATPWPGTIACAAPCSPCSSARSPACSAGAQANLG